MKYLVLFSINILLSLQSGFSQSVTQWRGKNSEGVFAENNLLKKWPEGGPVLLWSVTNLPKGHSSVIVEGNTIYTTGLKDQQDVLTAMDITGKIKWETPYGRAWDKSFPESRCTPTIDGNYVYVSSGYGDVACIDANTGLIKWQVKARDKFEGSTGRWGFAESLLVYGNNLLFTVGGSKTTVVALNKITGETAWATETLHDNPSYSSPILIVKGGQQQIISVTEKNVLGISPADGKILWKFPFGDYCKDGRNNNATTPLYFNNQVYVTSGYNHKSVMINVPENSAQPTLAWVDSVLDNHYGGVVRIGEYIYGSNWQHNGMGKWVCLHWKTGKVKYETTWINKGAIISDGENLYCYEEKTGNLALVKANPDQFEIISSFKIPLGSGPHWAHPVICQGVLYVRHGEALMAYKIKQE